MLSRRYTIDCVENLYQTHWIISISQEWHRGYSWSAKGRTIHEYKGAGDGAKVVIDAPAIIEGQFLNLLLQKAFVNNISLVVVPHARLNDMTLKFRPISLETVGV